MKILLIHNNYRSNLIGGEDLVFKREVDALIELLGEDNVYCYAECNDNLTFIKLLKNMFYSIKHKKNIMKLIQQEKIDIVHIHNFFPLLSTSIFQAAKETGVKVVHTLHNYRWWCIAGLLYREDNGICEMCVGEKMNLSGIQYGCYRNSKLQSFFATIAFFIYKKLDSLNNIDYFFALTTFQKGKLIDLKIPEEKIIVKPNFNVTKNDDLIDCKNKSGFVFVGRLEESKGIIELIENWRRIDKKLVIIGDGPLSEYVRQNVTENIRFIGKMNNEQVKTIIMESKYLLQLSKVYETFGLTMIEAFQMGTPVIGLDIGTRKEFIVDGFNGYLMKDLSELKKTIEKADVCKNYRTMVENSLSTAERYSKSNVVSRQVTLYQKMIQGEKM